MAVPSSAGSRRSRSSWAGVSTSAFRPPAMALRVVSLPAVNSSVKKNISSGSLSCGRVLARQLGLEHDREQVVARLLAALGDQLDAISREHAPVLAVQGIAGLRLEPEVHPVAEHLAVLLGHAEQQADGLERQVARHVAHEVAGAARGQRVEDAARAAAQLRLERADPVRREALVHEPADPPVPGVVHHVEHQPGARLVGDHGAALRPAASRDRGVRLRVELDGERVRVAAHHPEALALRRVRRGRVPVDGRMRAQPA